MTNYTENLSYNSVNRRKLRVKLKTRTWLADTIS